MAKSNLVHVTIDGHQLAVPAGTLVVEAAKLIGNDIPVFCYHPKLDPVGMCRMCLVEIGTPKMDPATRQPMLDENGQPIIAMMPKPQTACTQPVSEGMVVKTTTDAVADARRSILEFLLTSHPLDCPICDKGGECPLQELTIAYGPGVSRMPLGSKFHLAKAVPLGDLIMLDRERCIQCARCIRFQDEIADDHVLEFKHRGRAMEIVSMSDPPFDSKWSGNTTDICPVGALTSRDFRFKGRPWELDNTASICTLCSVGCNTTLAVRYDDIKRVMPRENESVNEIWLCDKGRFGHKYANAPDRLTQPLVRRSGQLQPATWEEALAYAAERLNTVKSTHGPDSIGGLAGDRVANEDLYLFQKLLRGVVRTNNVDHATRAEFPANVADLVAQVGVGSGSNLQSMGKGSAILVIGGDPDEQQPVTWLRIKQAADRRGVSLMVANPRPTKLDRYTRQSLRYRYGMADHLALGLLAALWELVEEGVDLVVDKDALRDLKRASNGYSTARAATLTGVATDALRAAAQALAQASDAVICFGSDLNAAGAQALANLLLATNHVGRPDNGLVPLYRHNNAQGAQDMGVRPDRLPGYRDLDDGATLGDTWGVALSNAAGLAAAHMLTPGTLRAMIVMATDPVGDDPGARYAIQGLDFMVVQELFMTPTAELADVVLPATSWAERDGTFTSTDRRIQYFSPAIRRLGQARPDWEILSELAQRLRAHEDVAETAHLRPSATRDWTYVSVDQIMAEIAVTQPHYAGMRATIPAIVSQRGRLPFEGVVGEGTAFKFSAAEDDQWPVAAEVGGLSQWEWIAGDTDMPAVGSGELLLVPVRRLFDQGTLISKADLLRRRLPGPYVVMNPNDAAGLGVGDNELVTVTTEHGSAEVDVHVSDAAPEGVLLIADRMGAPLRGVVLDSACRPAAATIAPAREMVVGD
ncbi:MAG: NADH-quinone oxidoreductase subunit NuoG [Anaerolineae bacterium]|nr:NADH-quinone oxidoreductase subunit NuoG [Anaerolineae bacterium]